MLLIFDPTVYRTEVARLQLSVEGVFDEAKHPRIHDKFADGPELSPEQRVKYTASRSVGMSHEDALEEALKIGHESEQIQNFRAKLRAAFHMAQPPSPPYGATTNDIDKELTPRRRETPDQKKGLQPAAGNALMGPGLATGSEYGADFITKAKTLGPGQQLETPNGSHTVAVSAEHVQVQDHSGEPVTAYPSTKVGVNAAAEHAWRLHQAEAGEVP